MTTTGIDRACPISAFGLAGMAVGAAVHHNDVILTTGLHTTGRVAHTPISHVSLLLVIYKHYSAYI